MLMMGDRKFRTAFAGKRERYRFALPNPVQGPMGIGDGKGRK